MKKAKSVRISCCRDLDAKEPLERLLQWHKLSITYAQLLAVRRRISSNNNVGTSFERQICPGFHSPQEGNQLSWRKRHFS
jgi:hypothetical protein